MKILVINAGSSSLKWKLWEFPAAVILDQGLVERIGENAPGRIRFGQEESVEKIPSHETALLHLKNYLDSKGFDRIEAVGHRVVHGGEVFLEPLKIDQSVKEQIKSLFFLAPLHNPPNFSGIEAAEHFFPQAIQVAVFDTAFHRTIPEEEHRYAIPGNFYKKGIRQYGFHGISHAYLSKEVLRLTEGKAQKIISLHLGNGASATAVLNGKSVAHSMGFGPLSGLIMGTRSGDIDPSVLLFLQEKEKMDVRELSTMLNKESGLKGLTGFNDMRIIEEKFREQDKHAQLAMKMFAGRIKKYIGYFSAVMNGLDTLIFSGGIGENSALVRKSVCQDMEFFGIKLDENANENPEKYNGKIHHSDSSVQIWVIPTNEEKEIAIQTYNLIHEQI